MKHRPVPSPVLCWKGVMTLSLQFGLIFASFCFIISPRVEGLATRTFQNGKNHNVRPRLTVILPAYNEQDRISETIQRYSSYLDQFSIGGEKNEAKTHPQFTSQMLIVSDGSSDQTVNVAKKISSKRNSSCTPIQVVSLEKNRGKGAAIARGIQEVIIHQDEGCGGIVLVADADGSGEISCVENLLQDLTDLVQGDFTKPAMVVGDRGYQGTSVSRAITRWGFRTTVLLCCGNLGVRDTQCGFKLMTASAAQMLYQNLYLTRWAHDVEVIFRAKRLKVPVAERVVVWQDKKGSKLEQEPGGTIRVSLVMLLEVLRMRLKYATGKWQLPKEMCMERDD